jgi:hypothetical protein
VNRRGFFVAAVGGAAPLWGFQPPSWGVPPKPGIEGAQLGPVTGKPVSGKETRSTTQTLSDGTHVSHTDSGYFYRDAAGRMRAESPETIEIIDTVGHMQYEVNRGSRSYRKYPFHGDEPYISIAVAGKSYSTNISSNPTGNRPVPVVPAEDLGVQKINGVSCRGSRVTHTIPVGAFGNDREVKIVNERWFSDELQVLVKSSNNDPRFGLNTYDLTEISQSAPDPSLFQPPAGYSLVQERKR